VAPLRTISNSVVKRYSGENSWRVASCKDSSMPGLYFNNKESPILISFRIGDSLLWDKIKLRSNDTD
jgi:hypothetical protein